MYNILRREFLPIRFWTTIELGNEIQRLREERRNPLLRDFEEEQIDQRILDLQNEAIRQSMRRNRPAPLPIRPLDEYFIVKNPDDTTALAKRIEGSGIRAEGKLRPSVQNLLNSVENEKVSTLTVWRRILPYSRVVKFLAPNVAPDKLYHTSLNINNKYNLEKDGITISFSKGTPHGETLSVPVSKNLTIKELFEKTRKRMGDANFTDYNVETLNCQNFVDNILSAISSNSAKAKSFIMQDAMAVVESLGGQWAKSALKALQSVQEAADVIQEGGCQCGEGGIISSMFRVEPERSMHPNDMSVEELALEIAQINDDLRYFANRMEGMNEHERRMYLLDNGVHFSSLRRRGRALQNALNFHTRNRSEDETKSEAENQAGSGVSTTFNYQLPRCKIQY
jgi:hypothetical protein